MGHVMHSIMRQTVWVAEWRGRQWMPATHGPQPQLHLPHLQPWNIPLLDFLPQLHLPRPSPGTYSTFVQWKVSVRVGACHAFHHEADGVGSRMEGKAVDAGYPWTPAPAPSPLPPALEHTFVQWEVSVRIGACHAFHHEADGVGSRVEGKAVDAWLPVAPSPSSISPAPSPGHKGTQLVANVPLAPAGTVPPSLSIYIRGSETCK